MSHPEITMSEETTHNPNESRHFMCAKPVPRIVRVRRGGKVIAESNNVLRITELGKDMYDPVFYFPKEDIIASLIPVEGKTSHCPLKVMPVTSKSMTATKSLLGPTKPHSTL
jgi:uncharacterized protein (DUF427 family)